MNKLNENDSMTRGGAEAVLPRIIGAGLAGAEAALSLAELGIRVELFEMKPIQMTEAHHSRDFAELVCSNSLKARRLNSASGLLKYEALALGSELLPMAMKHAVPAGGALAIDREEFSSQVSERIRNHPLIEVREARVDCIDPGHLSLIATGPLTEPELLASIQTEIAAERAYFFDAAAPIIARDSIDFGRVFSASRYQNPGADQDYLNCPMEREEYERFYEALVSAEVADIHDFERRHLFSACMPIEEIARTGRDSMRFGPLKPVGLIDPHTGRRPYACVQLRREDTHGEMWNLVGFQTRLKFPEQKRVFSMIPGLESMEFYRYGVMHRNSYLHAPSCLNLNFSAKKNPLIFFAGQITGLEGYVPAIASGRLAALNIYLQSRGEEPLILPAETMLGALQHYLNSSTKDYQPMTANLGILAPLELKIRDKKRRAGHYAARSLRRLLDFMTSLEERESADFLRAHMRAHIISEALGPLEAYLDGAEFCPELLAGHGD
ncbi:MAG: methylenetetrahydrofolate--tRNA-(uracil(54)-C(5))-methyltransferase (FADH(2)-oxidizing) TrmFO [Eubacteriales bacterium]|nr:methylenetetrahydrofolate--tRNA-(uracil(54)-C(5))-methyltransferase (FADH(2)-oxidizing) TrmFO [Eubacteriales bacterium]